MMMTTEGALAYGDIMNMDEVERLFWLQKCIDHNEKQEEDYQRSKRSSGRR
jgi:hypothetical protein